MKKNLLVALLIFTSGLFAQEQETLLSGDVEFGGFGGPVVKFTNINDEFGVLVGGYGGLLINHTFLIGLGGYGLANNIRPNQQSVEHYGFIQASRIEFGYGGLVLEYIGNPNRLLHYSISTLIGAGGVSFNEKDLFDDEFEFDDDFGHDAVFAMELNAAVEMNVTSFFRFSVGAGYRFINGVNLVGIKNEDLSGPAANLTLKFGKF